MFLRPFFRRHFQPVEQDFNAAIIPAPAPPPGDIVVLASDDTDYTVPLSIRTSAGTAYVVTSTVLASDNTPYVVI